MSPRTIKTLERVAIVFALFALLFSVFALLTSPARATQGEDHKVGLCHRTASDSNPYVFIEVDEASLPAHLNDLPGHPPKAWKADGTFRGVEHSKGDLKRDYVAESATECVDTTPEPTPTETTPTPTPTETTPTPEPTETTPTPEPTDSTPTVEPTRTEPPLPCAEKPRPEECGHGHTDKPPKSDTPDKPKSDTPNAPKPDELPHTGAEIGLLLALSALLLASGGYLVKRFRA